MLRELDPINEIKFVHPKDVQDGKIELSENDITTNLPYDPRVGIAFDHHESEIDRLRSIETGGKLIIDENARSAAEVVYDYYGGKDKYPNLSEDLVPASFYYGCTYGSGRFHDFHIFNYDLICNRQSGAVKHSGCRFLFIYSMDV